MADKTVAFCPFGDRTYAITGSAHDAGVVGELERSGGRYQHDLALMLRRRLPPDAVVVDGGAHIGVLTVLLADLCPAGHVYAFEPAPATRAHLAANLAANFVTNVTVDPAALLDRDGEVVFDFNPPTPAGAHVAGAGGDARPGASLVSVPAVRLDTWAKEGGVERLDLVKLDLEGAEPAALDGAQGVIRDLRPLTVVECNPFALRRFGGSTWRDLLAVMRDLFPALGFVAPGGLVLPVLSTGHLELLLGHHGIADLVGLPHRPQVQEWATGRARAQRNLAGLARAHNRRRPPTEDMVIDPAVDLAVEVDHVTGHPGGSLTVPVTVTNRSRWWLSSRFPKRPVHVSYRWRHPTGAPAVAEGHRTPFSEPLGPGRSTRLDVAVQLPPAPGSYELAVTIVQEWIAWFDELDPACVARVPATVE